MYINDVIFECYQDTTFDQVERSINQYLDALRYQGQILGREFPIAIKDGYFQLRLVTPEPNSLHGSFLSPQGKKAIEGLKQAGLLSPKIKLVGEDLNSQASADTQPPWQILYTTYVHTCSPLRSGLDLSPIPLYQIPTIANGSQKQAIKWQEDWEACDQLQMNGSILEHGALHEISSTDSQLFRRGYDLAKRIEYLTKVPTYYYLYRVGGGSLAQEQARTCPRCQQDWRLPEPELDIFDFKCEPCRLVSNLSWDFKK
ncbi:Zn-ribbon-containing protein [Motilimonas cestriensis]|uniref:Zn-ribbon-containing protein n=1 Tax=Motilimonas cestriensis TaxID=2742685 RepID=A0ABS8W4V1_9GAMM|nr:Zn-ribbon-containing protein [Motilimonas cestriensis]MCE2593548.1 Zn-ribbon-containing protein [Motilimonas cestriensis]